MIEDKPANAFVAYNYDRKESDLDFYQAQELEEKLSGEGFFSVKIIDNFDAGFSAQDVQEAAARPLWKIFVVLALIFAAAEICVGRFL
jgi:hypothetical protein